MSFDIAKHYETCIASLISNEGSVYVSNQPRTGDEEANESKTESLLRGKSLFAGKNIQAGDVVFVERNVARIVEPSSSKFVHTCDYCMRALGSLESQVRFISRALRKKGSPAAPVDNMDVPFTDLVREYTKERVAAERAEHGLPPQTEEWPLPDHILEVSEENIVNCPNGSGERFCSKKCQENAFSSYLRVFVDDEQTTPEESKTTTNDDEEESDEEEEDTALITEEESFDEIKKKSLSELVSSLRKFAKETNPLLFLASKVIASVAGAWADEITRIAEEKVTTGRALSLTQISEDSTEPVVTHEESTSALLSAVSPFLLYSQAPWWSQVQIEVEDHGEEHGHGHSHGGAPCHGHGNNSHSHGHGHGHSAEEQAEALQNQLFDLVQRAVNLLGPILVKFEQRISRKVNVCTLPLNEDEPEPEPPVFENETQLKKWVNDIPARLQWYGKICRFGPIGLANAFTIGCLMGMFEMNNIGTVSRAGFLDYVEFVAGELDADDLQSLRELLTKIYAKSDADPNDNVWKSSRYDVSTKEKFAASIRARKTALKKQMGVTRFANLLKRAQEHPLGTGLYAIGCCMNHSCEPNVAVMKRGDGRDDVTCFIAMKDIEANDELCISYIDDEDQLKTEERQELLRDYLFECRCAKCSKPKPKPKKKVVKKKPAAK